mmetsp:Transcript_5819/g.16760  ORF Transcript_5819/g.16760 Transcript_5819/m.16760 type:complete len:302 (+) Transcript_5819:2896-3801(+)
MRQRLGGLGRNSSGRRGPGRSTRQPAGRAGATAAGRSSAHWRRHPSRAATPLLLWRGPLPRRLLLLWLAWMLYCGRLRSLRGVRYWPLQSLRSATGRHAVVRRWLVLLRRCHTSATVGLQPRCHFRRPRRGSERAGSLRRRKFALLGALLLPGTLRSLSVRPRIRTHRRTPGPSPPCWRLLLVRRLLTSLSHELFHGHLRPPTSPLLPSPRAGPGGLCRGLLPPPPFSPWPRSSPLLWRSGALLLLLRRPARPPPRDLISQDLGPFGDRLVEVAQLVESPPDLVEYPLDARVRCRAVEQTR